MQDGHKVRVRLAVRQPLPRQLEHLSCTFGVDVDLWTGARQGQATASTTASPVCRVSAPDPTSHPQPKTDGQTSPTALRGANRAAGQPEDKRAKAGSRTDAAKEQGNRKDFQPPHFIQNTTLCPRAHRCF